jgi:hypothetical protein
MTSREITDGIDQELLAAHYTSGARLAKEYLRKRL